MTHEAFVVFLWAAPEAGGHSVACASCRPRALVCLLCQKGLSRGPCATPGELGWGGGVLFLEDLPGLSAQGGGRTGLPFSIWVLRWEQKPVLFRAEPDVGEGRQASPAAEDRKGRFELLGPETSLPEWGSGSRLDVGAGMVTKGYVLIGLRGEGL